MLFEPIEIELDKPRQFILSAKALMRAEKEINRQRGAAPSEHVSIDYLIFKAARHYLAGTGNFPIDLVAVLLWAGLNAAPQAQGELTVEKVLELLDASVLPRGKILTAIWDHYQEVTQRERKSEPPPDDDAEGQGHPLAQRPGSTSGALQ